MRSAILLIIFLLSFALRGQVPSGPSVKGNVSLTYANDYFTATDRYFTQGVGLRVGSVPLANTFLIKPMLRLHGDEQPLLTVLVQQDCYTPSSIRTDTIRPDDRPFAGALYIGEEVVSSDPQKGLRVQSSLIIGALGPCAACSEEQHWIHHGLGNIEPLGWQYQEASAVLLNYAVDVEKRLYGSRWMEIRGGANGMLGTYKDNAGATATVELGKGRSVFDPVTVRPMHTQFKAYGKAGVQFIGYDASMQGGVFDKDSPHVVSAADVERVVLGYGWGAQLSFHRLDLGYSEWYIGRTFRDGLTHGWGNVLIRGWF